MTMPGETITTGADPTCSECGVTPKLQVCMSPGSGQYYVGTYCKCGPYSRETDYVDTRGEAETMLKEMQAGSTAHDRTTEFNEEGAKQMQCIELDPDEPLL